MDARTISRLYEDDIVTYYFEAIMRPMWCTYFTLDLTRSRRAKFGEPHVSTELCDQQMPKFNGPLGLSICHQRAVHKRKIS